MKNILILLAFLSLPSLISPMVSYGQSIDEIDSKYNSSYEALKPPAGSSSVGTDYVFEQTALSTRQTATLLRLIYNQNAEMLSRYEQVLERYDEIIRQNNEIIRLLSKDDLTDKIE